MKGKLIALLAIGALIVGVGTAYAATTDSSVVSLTVSASQNLAVITDPIFGTLSASTDHQQAGTPLTLQFNSNNASVEVNMYQDNGAIAQQGLIHSNGVDRLIMKFYMDWAGTGILDPNVGTNWEDAWVFVKDLTADSGQKNVLYLGGEINKIVSIGLATDIYEDSLMQNYSTTLYFELINP